MTWSAGGEVRKAIGYTGQSTGVEGELTGRENLTLIGHLYKLPRALVRQRVDELLAVLQLEDAADRPAYTYSGGMCRRLDPEPASCIIRASSFSTSPQPDSTLRRGTPCGNTSAACTTKG